MADGSVRARRALPEMYDKSGNYMYGIGNSVSAGFWQSEPAKICESGIRHIIGHSYVAEPRYIDSFIHSTFGKVENVYYDL